MSMSIATELEDLRDDLKTKIETKFNTTCNSTTIKALIRELNTQIDNNNTITPPTLTNKSISEQITSVASYLCDVLALANINASVNEGFTTIISKIDNIVTITPITPTIGLTRSSASVTSGSSITLTATVVGDTDHGTPVGSVQFFEGTSTTPFATVSTPTSTTTSRAVFKTTRSKTVSSQTTYKFSAKFVSGDNTYYNDSAKSSQVSTTWKPPVKDVTITISASNKNWGVSNTVTATLKDSDNNAVTSKAVTVTIDGTDYSATTNSSGVATVSYTTPSTVKSYNIVVTSASNSLYNQATATKSVSTTKRNVNITSSQTSIVTNGSWAGYVKDAVDSSAIAGESISGKYHWIINGTEESTDRSLASATSRYTGEFQFGPFAASYSNQPLKIYVSFAGNSLYNAKSNVGFTITLNP